MSDPVTSNRGMAVPVHGSDVNSWDVPLNANFGLLDTIVGGVAAIGTTGGTTTLAANILQCGTIRVSGALASTAQIFFPAVDGWWTIHNLTTGSTVLQVIAGIGTQVIALPPGLMTDIQVSGNSVYFRNLQPIGTYLDVASSTVPLWINSCTVRPFLNCDGSSFSGATYPYLAAFLGGTTLPDLRGVAPATLNQGTGRMTSSAGGVDGDTLFAVGGADSRPLSVAQLPTGIPLNIPQVSITAGNAAIPVQGNVLTGGSPLTSAVLFGANNTGLTQVNALVTGTVTVGGTAEGGGRNHTTMQPTTISGLRLIRSA